MKSNGSNGNGTNGHRNAYAPPPDVKVLHRGGPCTCAAGRYVRWVDPPGVPGLEPAVHCRDVNAEQEGRRTHELPPGAVVEIFVPDLTIGAAS